MKHLKIAIVLLILLPLTSNAWNSNGHRTCGAIAYYYMKDHCPDLIPKITSVLEQHPWINNPIWTQYLDSLKEKDQRSLYLFMLASTFPDDSRDSSYGKYPMTTWHYINLPFTPDGPCTKVPAAPSVDAVVVLKRKLDSLNLEYNPQTKAINMCWIFHLIEDLHEPMHTTALIDHAHPKGDQGGNMTYFYLVDGVTPQKLHSYWDGLVLGYFARLVSSTTTPGIAQSLYNSGYYSSKAWRKLKANTTIHDWVWHEGYPLAVHKAYRDGRVSGTSDDPSPYPREYYEESTKIAYEQVLLAGIRISTTLQERLK